MAINETISTGNKYRRLKDAPTKLWQRLSFWTKASDVEFDNGATAETSLGNIQGITDSVNSNASNIAASAAAVNTLNSNIGNIKIYVGEDGKIHFTNKDGADSVLNFSSFKTEEKTFSWDGGGDMGNYGIFQTTLVYSGKVLGIVSATYPSQCNLLQPRYGTKTFPFKIQENVVNVGWTAYGNMAAGSMTVTVLVAG